MAKCRVLHLGQSKPQYQYRLGDEGIDNRPEEKDLGVLVGEKLHISQQCALTAQKGQSCAGLHPQQCGQQGEGGDSVPLYCALARPHQESCTQLWSPQHRKDMDLLEWVQKKATKMIRGLEHLSYEERL